MLESKSDYILHYTFHTNTQNVSCLLFLRILVIIEQLNLHGLVFE